MRHTVEADAYSRIVICAAGIGIEAIVRHLILRARILNSGRQGQKAIDVQSPVQRNALNGGIIDHLPDVRRFR